MSPPPATPSLRLVVADASVLEAAVEGPEALAAALGGCKVVEGWSVFPEALPVARNAIAADPASARWGTRFFVIDDPSRLVGWGGFKGGPADGVVELRYEIAPEHRNHGLATAAVRAMLAEAFAALEVEAVIAHTLGEPGPSNRVLEKAGFSRDGGAVDEDAGPIWRWRLERPA